MAVVYKEDDTEDDITYMTHYAYTRIILYNSVNDFHIFHVCRYASMETNFSTTEFTNGHLSVGLSSVTLFSRSDTTIIIIKLNMTRM